MSQTKYSYISKPLALLTIAHGVTDLSQGALPAMLPFLKNFFHLTYAQVGAIVLTQNLTSSVIQPLFGFITDKVFLPWLIPVSLLLAGVGMAATGLATSYYLLLVTIVVSGLGIAGFHPQASKSAHLISSAASKGRSMGMFSVGGNFGAAAGSIFMTALLSGPGTINNTIYFLIPAALMTLLAWQNLPHISPQVSTKAAAAHTPQQTAAALPWGLLATLLSFIFIRSSIHTGLSTYIPLYYADYLSGSPLYASYLLSAFLIAGVVGTYAGGLLSDRFGRKTVILVSMTFSMPLIFLFQFTSGFVTVILAAITGLTLISSFATTVVMAQEMMPHHIGMASGLTIGFTIGLGGIGATILGYVADHYGIPSVFTILTALPIMGLFFASFLPGKLFKRDIHPAA
jgi:FSR family fosmidomycin resistance protein-like MFS transporter